MEWEWDL